MYPFLIEIILGIITGLFFGTTGLAPTGMIILILDLLKIGDYKSNLGSIMFLNLFPISIGSVYEFYKSNQINYTLGVILLFSVIFGSYIGSKMVVGKENILTIKHEKYITSLLGFIIGFSFLISAYHEKN
jgi:uncharacterized membrane protein YfcA